VRVALRRPTSGCTGREPLRFCIAGSILHRVAVRASEPQRRWADRTFIRMDPRERLRAGEQAAREGRHEEALDHYVWFHEHALEHDRALYGVRLSFALASWAELARAYPRAAEVLTEIRDRKTERLRTGEGNHDVFNDVEAINEYLDDHEATYRLFVELHSTFPELAKTCASVAMPVLIKKQDYKLARIFMEQPEEAIRQWSATLENDIAAFATKPPVKEAFIRIYVEHVREILEAFTGVGEVETASKLRRLAIENIDAADVRASVENALPELPLR